MTATASPTMPGSGKSRPFSQYLKGLFFFLVALFATSQISPLVLLNGLIRQEDELLAARLENAGADLRRLCSSATGCRHNASDLTTLARSHHLTRIWISVGDTHDAAGTTWDTVIIAADVAPSAERVGDPLRSLDIVATCRGEPVRGRVTIAAPLAAGLRRQLHSELWLRGAILLAFGFFTWLFYRSVLRPFHDMRQRAKALVDTGLLPSAPGQVDQDPEYVMATFDILVRRLLAETKTLESRAAQSERRSRSLERFNDYILSSLSTGVIILDRHGEILRFNRAAEQILHMSAATVCGRTYAASGLSEGLVELLRVGLSHGRVFSRHELRIDRANGDPLYLGINTSCIRTDTGEVVGLSLLLTDLTEIKRLQDEVAENQRLADLGELSAGLAHQLRNAIAAILGYGKLLRHAQVADAKSGDWIEAIIGETQETSEMLTRFLDFARPLRAERRPLDLRQVIADAIDAAGPSLRLRQLRMRQSGADVAALVLGDALLLKQVLLNLIQNAAEASPADGEIRVSLEQTGGDEKSRRWQITVSDRGPGVKPEDRARIFQPFFTTKDSGTGLGLPLARKIVGFHGGTLTLESTGPDGSTFAVTLPAAVAHEVEMAATRGRPYEPVRIRP
ncbi:MAG: ATP-binding protein [Candidatus Zixiibacteriota bacterium]